MIRTLTRDGATIAFEVVGSGPAVLLGHSLLCGRWMMTDLVTRLSASHTVVSVEFRGHGESTAPAAFTMDDLAADALAVLDVLGIARATFGGVSMGGMVGMRCALIAPERVAGLLLIDSNANAEALSKWIRYAGLRVLYRHLGFNNLLSTIVSRIMLGKTTCKTRPEMVAELVVEIRKHDRTELLRAIAAVVDRNDISARIEQIRCPTLVLCGEEDVATPPRLSRRLHQKIKGSILIDIPHAGHLAAWEQPARVGDEVETFLITAGL